MANLEFADIAQLISRSRITTIEEQPQISVAGQWALYKGIYKVHTREIPFEVLYVMARATAESLQDAQKRAFKPNVTQVVYAPSVDKRLRALQALKKNAAGFFTLREYLISFIRDELATYSQRLADLKPRFFVEPRIEVPAGFTKRRPNALVSFLADIPTDRDTGALAVLLAEAGQGKTYLTEHVASVLSTSKGTTPIPIYIRSSQWSVMAADDLRSPFKAIVNAFRAFQTPIAWIEGNEDLFLSVTLRAGLFCIVFDGFDEFVLRNQGRVSAQEVLEALRLLALESGARIAVTSRTSFWSDEVVGEGQLPQGVDVYRLLSFDPNHARNYFRARLAEASHVDRAMGLYGRVRVRDEDIAGRGFVLNLIADITEASEEPSGVPTSSASGIAAWLMEALCDRELLRHSLPLSAKAQMDTFRLFVGEVTKGVAASTETLELSLSVSSNLSDTDRRAVIQKFRVHPLLHAAEDEWSISQEQLQFILLAQYVLALADPKRKSELNRFVVAAQVDAAVSQQVAEIVVDLASGPSGQTTIQALVKSMLGGEKPLVASEDRSGRGLAVAIAFAAVEKVMAKGETHAARVKTLRTMLPDGVFRSLPLTGTITNYDFRAVVFEECRFERVTIVNCEFDASTRFVNCTFIGTRSFRSPGLGLAVFSGCSQDVDSAAWIRASQISAGGRYDKEDLVADIRSVVEKFVGRGGVAPRTLVESRLSTGSISVSRHKEDILEELRRSVIEEHEISGVSEKGLHIRPSAADAVRFFAENNVFTGELRGAYERLVRKLGI